MNKNTQTRRVLILEHPYAIPSIVSHLKAIERETNESLELFFATSAVEAQTRLRNIDIAIIEVEGMGHGVAHTAVKLEIPTIATSLFFKDLNYKVETDRLKLIAKPEYFRFEEAVKQLLGLLRKEETEFALAA